MIHQSSRTTNPLHRHYWLYVLHTTSNQQKEPPGYLLLRSEGVAHLWTPTARIATQYSQWVTTDHLFYQWDCAKTPILLVRYHHAYVKQTTLLYYLHQIHSVSCFVMTWNKTWMKFIAQSELTEIWQLLIIMYRNETWSLYHRVSWQLENTFSWRISLAAFNMPSCVHADTFSEVNGCWKPRVFVELISTGFWHALLFRAWISWTIYLHLLGRVRF